MDNTTGKIVAITGASSGIGEATALRLAAAGAKLVLGARRAEPLASLVERITISGGSAVYAVTDVRQRADAEKLVALARDTYGRLDVMINNAGIGPISLMDELRVDDWIDMVDVNIKGVLYGIAAALPVFRAQKSGHIINTLSTAGIKIVPTMAVYAGTKNAVRTISEGLRQEAGPDLRVTVISPGMIATNFADSITSPNVRAAIGKQVGEIAISPDAIARAIAFAIDQPRDVDVGEIVVRPTAQS
ncbi:MAG TPA: SDR family oxidoreductase [Kofleriaceae bacterium]|jgi:NADP-dependent 3-hydroxy acid dehydrogenase YdfG